MARLNKIPFPYQIFSNISFHDKKPKKRKKPAKFVVRSTAYQQQNLIGRLIRETLDPPHNLLSLQHLTKRKTKRLQPGLMLLLIRRSTSIRNKPSLKATIKRTPTCRITAAIRHHATNNHPLNALGTQHLLQQARSIIATLKPEESIVRVLGHDRQLVGRNEHLNVRKQLPLLGASGDAAVRAPFADQLVRERRGELEFAVAVLRYEDRLSLRGKVAC